MFIHDFNYSTADNFDDAWLNFELDLPLPSGLNGTLNPFYVQREKNPLARLERELTLPFKTPPKLFLSGHRGCGKSTELYRLADLPRIQAKFWPVHFSIKDHADIGDIDYRDVLLTIGAQLFTQHQERGSRPLPDQLLTELDQWRGKLEHEITTVITSNKESEVGSEVGVNLGVFFAKIGGKLSVEPKTREEIRQVLERDITGLVGQINAIVAEITRIEKKPPIILIDDLDKPPDAQAKHIFFDNQPSMLRPNCAIVYTISSSLYYSQNYATIKNRAFFLPNIKLHEQGQRDVLYPAGYRALEEFVKKRMVSTLIADDALTEAITMSGGVFREMARLMREAIGNADIAGRTQIEVADVNEAAATMRRDYWRTLSSTDRALLREVRDSNRLDAPEKLTHLLRALAVLEYENGGTWCDIHPVLLDLLNA